MQITTDMIKGNKMDNNINNSNKLLILPKSPLTFNDNDEQCYIIIQTLKEHATSIIETSNGNIEFQLEGQTLILTPEIIKSAAMLRAVLMSLMLLYVDHSKLINTSTERLMNDANHDNI